MPEEMSITLTVNGAPYTCRVEPRRSLLDCLRDDLRLRGTHVGCEHGVCGACNVVVDGALVRSCLMLAYQAEGAEIRTIEGIGTPDGGMSPVQEALCAHHGMQCGYCTPGVVMALETLLEENPAPTHDELIDALSGNICRCTGYQQIVDAAESVIAERAGERS